MHNEDWQTPDDLFQVLDEGGEYQGIHFDGFHFDIDLAATADNSKCKMWACDYLNDNYDTLNESLWLELKDNDLITTNKTCWLNPPYSRELIKPFIQKAWEDSKHCKIVCLVKVDPSTEWWSTFWDYGDESVICYWCKGVGTNYDFNQVSEVKSIIPCTVCDVLREYEVDKTYLLNSMRNLRKRGRIELKAGPKPGCSIIYLPKRIKFDPPVDLDLICSCCKGSGELNQGSFNELGDHYFHTCDKCKGTGKRKLNGPSFPSCLLIFDRRGYDEHNRFN